MRGVPQVRELGGRTVFLYPIFHPAAALYTPAMLEQLRGGLPGAAGAARPEPSLPGRCEPAGAGARADAAEPEPEPAPSSWAPASCEPPDQLGLF